MSATKLKQKPSRRCRLNTVVSQSDEDDQDVVVLRSGRTLSDLARNAAGKKAAATCEACDAPIGDNDTCLSGNTKLCEICDKRGR